MSDHRFHRKIESVFAQKQKDKTKGNVLTSHPVRSGRSAPSRSKVGWGLSPVNAQLRAFNKLLLLLLKQCFQTVRAMFGALSRRCA